MPAASCSIRLENRDGLRGALIRLRFHRPGAESMARSPGGHEVREVRGGGQRREKREKRRRVTAERVIPGTSRLPPIPRAWIESPVRSPNRSRISRWGPSIYLLYNHTCCITLRSVHVLADPALPQPSSLCPLSPTASLPWPPPEGAGADLDPLGASESSAPGLVRLRNTRD